MENTLYYVKKAKEFEEALPLGNGRMGAMVFGDLKKERIALNEDTLWSGYPDKQLNTKGAYKHLDELRGAIFNNDFEKAKEIANGGFHGHWTESYLPFGDLLITYKSKIKKDNYRRYLNIARGVATVSCDGIKETVFVSHPNQLIVVNLKSSQPFSCDVTFASQLQSSVSTEEDSLVISGCAPEVCFPPYYKTKQPIVYGSRGMKFTGIAKILGNAKFESDKIVVRNETEVTILVSLATSYVDFNKEPDADSFAKAMAPFENATNYEQLLIAHRADFASLFDRVKFSLYGGETDLPTDKRLKRVKQGQKDNALIALLFNFGRYLAISSSRPGTIATNLQGIWNEHMRAPWSSNYTVNINTQMNYWGLDICNLSDCFEPLTELVKKFSVRGRETAKEYYNCGGYCLHHNTDIWGNTNPAGYPNADGDSSAYAVWQSGLPWFLNMLYDHYLYIKDEDYKQEITPLFQGCLDFYKDFLTEKDGELVTCPSSSPENSFDYNGKGYSLTYMPSMDREILHDFFKNCQALGLDAPEIQQVKPASDGRIPEWNSEYKEREPEHRHVSHLYCIYPSGYGDECDESLKKAAEKSLEVRGFGGTGWSLGWKVCLWARLGNGNNAERLIKQQLTPVKAKVKFGRTGGTYPNMFDAHPPFQIDGNFGVMAGIAEMIKNNAMPTNWNGRVSGIKLKDGTVLSGNIQNGKLILDK